MKKSMNKKKSIRMTNKQTSPLPQTVPERIVRSGYGILELFNKGYKKISTRHPRPPELPISVSIDSLKPYTRVIIHGGVEVVDVTVPLQRFRLESQRAKIAKKREGTVPDRVTAHPSPGQGETSVPRHDQGKNRQSFDELLSSDVSSVLGNLELAKLLREQTDKNGPLSEEQIRELDTRRNESLKKRFTSD
jgi:hypothetical protein